MGRRLTSAPTLAPNSTLGQRIRHARVSKAGLSQIALAKAIGKPQSSLSDYETDTVAPDEATLATIAEAVGVDVEALLGELPAIRTLPVRGLVAGVDISDLEEDDQAVIRHTVELLASAARLVMTRTAATATG